jgi:hypothetical protein
VYSVFTPLVTVSPSGTIYVSYEERNGSDIYVIQFESNKNGLPKVGSRLNTETSGAQTKVSIKFNLDGKSYTLAAHNNGQHLHGGLKGFDKKVWKTVSQKAGSLTLSYLSKDADQAIILDNSDLRFTAHYISQQR